MKKCSKCGKPKVRYTERRKGDKKTPQGRWPEAKLRLCRKCKEESSEVQKIVENLT